MQLESATERPHRFLLPGPVLRSLAASMARLTAVGLLAIGVSGLLAGGMGLLFSTEMDVYLR